MKFTDGIAKGDGREITVKTWWGCDGPAHRRGVSPMSFGERLDARITAKSWHGFRAITRLPDEGCRPHHGQRVIHRQLRQTSPGFGDLLDTA